jgi:hypothetical protein
MLVYPREQVPPGGGGEERVGETGDEGTNAGDGGELLWSSSAVGDTLEPSDTLRAGTISKDRTRREREDSRGKWLEKREIMLF